MSTDFRTVFKRTLKDESKILRPFFIPSPTPTKLVMEETYLRLRLSRMFLKNRRELFQTKYPVVNALMRFAGMDGKVEINYVAKPEMAGDGNTSRLDDIVTLDQTLLGPILYRGGDLELMLGLYAAPADDWAQRFISLAEGISQFVPNVALSTAVSVTSTIKTSIESALSSDGLDLKLGLDKELEENVWLAPGYLVMISAPDAEVDSDALTVKDGELMTNDGKVYTDHNYIVLEIEVTTQRSDWQSLGYGRLWHELLKTAANANDIQTVKDNFITFSGAVMSSTNLSWADRSSIVSLAQKRVTEIRKKRASVDFLDGMKGTKAIIAHKMALDELVNAAPDISAEPASTRSVSELMQTGWIE